MIYVQKMVTNMMILLFSLLSWSANIAGITFPDKHVVGEQTLSINGIGLREKFWIDIYAAALYLPFKSKNPNKVISSNVPKRLDIEFIYSKVPKQKMLDTFEQNLKDNPQIPKSAQKKMRSCYQWFQNFTTGDTVSFIYEPQKGTTFFINGDPKTTIEGTDFMEAVFTIYLGPKPASVPLRQSLLGLN